MTMTLSNQVPQTHQEKMNDVNFWHIDKKIKKKWDRIKDGRLKEKDDDRVYVTDGRERTGKSVFTLQQAAYIDPSMLVSPEEFCSRICFNAEEFLETIRKINSTDTITKCVVFDEAFRGLSSRAATSKVNKKILQALMEVGQKNLVLWIVLPSFFMLDLYPAMLRSNALFHIKKDRNGKGRSFGVYSYKKKGRLYQIGVRKGWQYFPTSFNGRFFAKFPGGEAFERAYRLKKYKALTESELNESNRGVIEEEYKQERERELLKWVTEGKSFKEIYEMEIARGDISNLKSIPKRIQRARMNVVVRERKEKINMENKLKSMEK